MAAPHVIPEGWRQSLVGEECRILNSLRLPISEEERGKIKGPFPYYGPTGVLDHLDHFRVEGTVALIGEDGDHFLKFADRDMTLLVSGQFNVNNHAHIVQGSATCLTEWFYTYMRGRCLTPHLTRQGVGRFKLTKASLESIPILIPPLPEQQLIHGTINQWDRALEVTERLISAKQERRAWLMQQLLTGKRRLPGFGKSATAGHQPEGWELPKTGKMFEGISRRNCGSEVVLSVTQDQGVVPRDSLDRKINMSFDNTDGYKLVEPGDFIISLRSFQGGIEYSRYRGLVSPAYHVIRPTTHICDDFYRFYFKSSVFIQRLTVAVIGIRDGKQVNFGDFAFMKIPQPPVNEQCAIAAVLNVADREIELIRQHVEVIRQQKKGLMQQLLTGKRRVKVTATQALDAQPKEK